jgi:predicted permease
MADLNNLFPAIAESFLVILIGYLFGRFKWVDPSEARSLTTIVGKLALPALLFKNLATLDLSAVSWRFLGSVLTAKFIVFAAVVAITLIVTRKFNRAGLYGIFTTQSNDFAIGLPIVQALYQDSDMMNGFHYISYIYLVAPISLGIINPIGFLMLEYSKQTSSTKLSCKTIPYILLRTFFYVFINPIILFTIFGVIVNVILTYGVGNQGWLPPWLVHFLDLLGGAYAPCALFNIGLFMVGKLRKITGWTILVSSLLIIAKSILLPLIGYVAIHVILPHQLMNETLDHISAFGFLYFTFPTAPTVFVYASQYNVAVSIVASSLVLGTFLSAPIMYVSGRMILVKFTSKDSYDDIISNTKLNACSISILCLCWVMLLFVLSRRYKSYLHVIIMHLMLAQFVECVSGLALTLMGKDLNYWIYFVFGLFFVGVFASRLWLISLSISLLMIIKKKINLANNVWFVMLFSSWSLPILVTLVMVLLMSFLDKPLTQVMDMSFLFGTPQLVISTMFLVVSFSVSVLCILYIIVYLSRQRKSISSTAPDDEHTSLLSNDDRHSNYSTPRRSLRRSISGTPDNGTLDDGNTDELVEVKSTTTVLSNNQSLATSLSDSIITYGVMSKYTLTSNTGTWARDESGKFLMRFVILILFLSFSCLVGILVVIWQLLNKNDDGSVSGTFVAAMVLDNVTNYGQGFFIFVVFGFEVHWFWIVIYHKIRRWLFKIEIVALPDQDQLGGATINLCNIFKNRYLSSCKEDIVSNKRYYFQVYNSVFSGSEFVDWMLDKGLADTRDDAVSYGQTLMNGRILAHVKCEHNFHDENYYYEFLI